MLQRIATKENEVCPQYFHLNEMLEQQDQKTKRRVRDRIGFEVWLMDACSARADSLVTAQLFAAKTMRRQYSKLNQFIQYCDIMQCTTCRDHYIIILFDNRDRVKTCKLPISYYMYVSSFYTFLLHYFLDSDKCSTKRK